MAKPYRAALCGLGNIAWRFDQALSSNTHPRTHAGAIQAEPGVTLVAGCDPDPARRVAFAKSYGLPVYTDLGDMLAAEQPDIVSVCSPTGLHASQTSLCLKHRVPMVWLEKPPTVTIDELDALSRLAVCNKATVLVNYQRRYEAAYRRLRHLCQGADLGSLRHLALVYSRGLRANGVHLLDILFFLLGDPKTFRITARYLPREPDHPSFHLAFAGGVEASVTGIPGLPYHAIDVTATFEQGRAAVLYGGMTAREERPVEHELFPGFYRLKETVASPTEGPSDNLRAALRDLVWSHETGRAPLSSLCTARTTQQVLDLVLSPPEGDCS